MMREQNESAVETENPGDPGWDFGAQEVCDTSAVQQPAAVWSCTADHEKSEKKMNEMCCV